MSELITVDHVAIARMRYGGYCVRGMREWFALHGLDFRDFLCNGIQVSVVEPINDEFVQRLISIARGL